MSKEEKKIEHVKSCPICCEIYTKHLRKEVACSYCNYSTCTNCLKTYIFSNMTEPNCMNCRKRFPKEVMFDNFSKKFINSDYKQHRENMLYEQEMSMMPSTQNIIELKNQVYELYKVVDTINEKISELEREKTRVFENINRYNHIYNNPAIYYTTANIKEQEKERNSFIKPCPRENCRGFLSTRYMCGVCNLKICSQCHEVKSENKEEEHKCDPDNIESVKLIKSDTKSCPKCGVNIFKISGCFDGETEILLYNDSIKKIKDVQVGDVVQGVNKSPQVVIEIFRGVDQMYKVIHKDTKDFENYIVNSKHDLVLKYVHHKYLHRDGEGNIIVKWYDRTNKVFNNKVFENGTQQLYNELVQEMKLIDNDDIIVIRVQDYVNLDKSVQEKLFAISVKKFYCEINIEKLEVNSYYGFKLSQNPFFLLPKGTVVSNCSQIWCTSCKTAFDWKSGNIINGPIHNPHYFDYLRSIGREDDEIQRRFDNGMQGINCINWNQLTALAERYRVINDMNFVNDIYNLSRHINHIRDYTLNVELANNYNNPEEVNADLRVQYLQNYLSKENFKIKIQRRDKRNSFNQHLREVVEMYADVLSDTFASFDNKLNSFFEKEKIENITREHLENLKQEFLHEINNLNDYTRKNSEKIMADYNYTSIPMFLFNSQSQIVKKSGEDKK